MLLSNLLINYENLLSINLLLTYDNLLFPNLLTTNLLTTLHQQRELHRVQEQHIFDIWNPRLFLPVQLEQQHLLQPIHGPSKCLEVVCTLPSRIILPVFTGRNVCHRCLQGWSDPQAHSCQEGYYTFQLIIYYYSLLLITCYS